MTWESGFKVHRNGFGEAEQQARVYENHLWFHDENHGIHKQSHPSVEIESLPGTTVVPDSWGTYLALL